MPCNNTCKSLFQTKSYIGAPSAPSQMWPICRTCEVRINFNGVKCPCCNNILSTRTGEGNKFSRDFTRQTPQRELKIKKSSIRKEKIKCTVHENCEKIWIDMGIREFSIQHRASGWYSHQKINTIT